MLMRSAFLQRNRNDRICLRVTTQRPNVMPVAMDPAIWHWNRCVFRPVVPKYPLGEEVHLSDQATANYHESADISQPYFNRANHDVPFQEHFVKVTCHRWR
ncbi:unnamed protein product [Zymoseptoria tritici ST99CH_3D7]|uniref:Uncharacterized protein n=1 Tax=Zymoseptoria tritici (strain ST99CH_3D7) TaxID=1276538 RepID=A0A1X7RD80_ZYMT9|nr:unnamed protein product [Zymoseptoria tritici ST99CH_3D7]